MKILNIILLTLLVVAIVLVGGYFYIGFYLENHLGYEYLFVHPTIAKIFNVTPVCSTTCSVNGGVCGQDGKTYCNKCVAFQHGAGYAHDGACVKPDPTANWQTYTNNDFGFTVKLPVTWNGYSIVKQTWVGHEINNYKKTYSDVEIIIKNPQTTKTQQWQDIPIMLFTPAEWLMVSGTNPTVAVSAAPIGPEKIGSNTKYIFATPPRWYGFTDDKGWQEAVEIVKTFKAF